MVMFCIVYVSSSQSNWENNKNFYRVPKIVVHNKVKLEKLTKKNTRKNCSPSFIGGWEEQN